MEIYYCGKCAGKPYTRKIKNAAECPCCGSILRFEDVSEESLAGRKELEFRNSSRAPDIMELIRHPGNRKESLWPAQFKINDGEIFYEYLCFEKTGTVDFNVRFVLGNQPDENAVITKTPFISPELGFVQNIEMSELELLRRAFERKFSGYGFVPDPRLFHAFVKQGEETVSRTVTEGSENERLTEEDAFSERYFINYDFQQFGDINIGSPFRKDRGIFTEVKRVLDSRSEKFMDYMIFRARNGDNMTLGSFADDSAVLFDNPHLTLIRYDRLLKEAQATRM